MGFEIENGILTMYRREAHQKEIVIPEGVTAIGNHAFGFCQKLTSVIIPEGVTRIGINAFWGCRSLTKITLPQSLTCIKFRAFADCSGLTSITIPENVRVIERNAFYRCNHLQSITVSEKNKYYYSEDGALYEKKSSALVCCPCGKKELTIHRNIPDILPDALNDCDTVLCVKDSRTEAKLYIASAFPNQDLLMALRGQYSHVRSKPLKYMTAIFDYIFGLNDTACQYLKRTLTRVMTLLIEEGNADYLELLLLKGELITARNIDRFIEMAIEQKQNEIQIMLMNYKNEKIGYKRNEFKI